MQQPCIGRAQFVGGPADGLEVLLTGPATGELELDPLANRVGRLPGEWALRPRIHVCLTLENRELGSKRGGVGHGADVSRGGSGDCDLRARKISGR